MDISSLVMASDLPGHVAIVMDGNGRWAQARSLPRGRGHEAGMQAAKGVVEACLEEEVPFLTVFAFSQENWRRPKQEVDFLMRLFERLVAKESLWLAEKGVRLQVMGERQGLAPHLVAQAQEAEALTAGGKKLLFTIATNYSGRWDMVQAARRLVEERGVEALSEEAVSNYLATSRLPEPDLLIRTGGEKRLSNFMLWQLAYTEIYFTDTLWPDFGADEFRQAIAWYGTRERRFGRTSEQLQDHRNPQRRSASYR